MYAYVYICPNMFMTNYAKFDTYTYVQIYIFMCFVFYFYFCLDCLK